MKIKKVINLYKYIVLGNLERKKSNYMHNQERWKYVYIILLIKNKVIYVIQQTVFETLKWPQT